MTLTNTLSETRESILDQLARAAKSGDARKSVDLARTLEQIERDYQMATDIERRLTRINGDLSSNYRVMPTATERVGSSESAKARGMRIQREFAARHTLLQFKGQEFRTSQGLSVGIATATEDKRRNRWFLGLPGRKFDVTVLVCDHEGRLLEFVIPAEVIDGVWEKLSRDKKGHLKFNVRREGGAYGDYQLLVSSASPVNIQPFLGAYAPLT